MKRFSKIFLLALSLIFILGIKGEALESIPPNIELEGNAEGIVFIPGNEPFLSHHNMVPGDRVSRKIIINNNYNSSYEIFLRAERVTNEEEFDLLKQINVEIDYEKSPIYRGKATGEDGLTENISLGVVNPKEKKELFALAELDGPSTGNEYKNKYGEVKWVFTAVNLNDGLKEPAPHKPAGGNGIDKGDITSPQTGDNGIILYCILAFGAFLLFSLNNRKKRRRV